MAEAQTDEMRNNVEGRTIGKNRETESVAVTNQGRVLG